MALSSGTRLGVYEILTLIGSGGMGEVYKARDTRLDRLVAVKILPPSLAADAHFRERFHREARTISRLDHPHICMLYDVGEQDGTSFLVMQYLEGETLEARLRKGALPLHRTIDYGIQIADALDKAHHAGIVHRDLKPGNIMLTKSGAKLLDFGLAKLRPSSLAVAGLSIAETATAAPVTGQGTILGTLNYMSPEQIEGREADARADIWALGLVLYEMVTGKRPFVADSPASLIAAILGTTPPTVAMVHPVTPRSFDRVVTSCLTKDRDARFHSAHDVAIQLRWIANEGSDELPARPEPWFRRRASLIAISLMALSLAATAWFALRNGNVAALRPVAFFVYAPENASFVPAPMFLTVSPNGRMLAFIASDANSTRRLWVRALDSTEIRLLPGTEDADQPFWSADSRSVAFVTATNSKLKRIEVGGGPPRFVCDLPGGQTLQGGTWNESGVILFATIGGGNPIFSVPASGGTPVAVTSLDREHGELAHLWPHFLPGGDRFLYLAVNAQTDRSGIYAAGIGDRGATRVLDALSNVVYCDPGILLFSREQTLLAQPFDPRRLTTTGEPIAIADQMGAPPGNGRSPFAASRNGVLAYRQQTGGPFFATLTWFDRTGKKLGAIGGPNQYRDTALSPDGTRVAAQIGWTVGSDIWIADVARGLFTRLTSDPANDESPVWSPDSARIAYASNRDGNVFNVYEAAADGSSPDRLLVKSDRNQRPLQWSADGKWLLLESAGLSAIALDRDKAIVPVGAGEPATGFGQLSSDAQWIAYASRESGRFEIYVQRFLTPSRKWQVSTNGGTRPHWRADRRELFFLGLDNKIYAVAVTLAGTPMFGSPVPLFPVRLTSTLGGATQFDGINVTPDGQRFLVTLQTETGGDNPITVRVNWQEELKQRVPVK